MSASSRKSVPLFLAVVVAALALAVAGCASSEPAASGPVIEQIDTTEAGTPSVPRSIPRTAGTQEAMGVDLDTVEAGRFDQGRMWTFEEPPLAYFEEAYGFTPDEAWFEKARLGALRIPGCTASFASPNGLVLTNHHCGRAYAVQVSRPGEDLLANGFYAASLGEERPVEDLYADQLVAIEDVTEEVYAALEGAETDAERAEARRQVFERIEARLGREASADAVHVEVVSLYHGGKYSAYVYRRYDDIRLVMIPELQVGYFGGDPDNFTYPRYALDMALFRVYDEGGEPLETEHYFAWSEEGSRPGEPVFVVGNPGSTLRLETVAQLAYRRDVADRALLRYLATRVDVLKAYAEAHPEEAEEVRNQIFGLENALKLYRGRLEALSDPVIMARREDAQEQFQAALEEEAALAASYGGLIDSMAALQEEKRALGEAYGAFMLLPSYASATYRRALLAYRMLQQQAQGASAEATADLRQEVLSIGEQPRDLNRRLLAARLEDFQEHFGADSDLVQRILQERTPEAAARAIMEGSVLADSAATAQALEAGTLSMEDPALELAGAFYERYQDFQSAMAGLNARQEEVARRLGRARYEVYGTEVPPDATFTLRIADGVVEGYPYNGTYAAPYTTFYGMYNHYQSFGAGTPWDLPAQWLPPPEPLERRTPLNLVSTNDITGGNSGSPLLNRELELVGLVFDGNIESLASAYIYLPRRMRAVSVDVRGMLEALDDIYDADRLVEELTTGTLVESEAAAEAAASGAR